MKAPAEKIGRTTLVDGSAYRLQARRIRLRPHHLLCIRGFRGYGYGDEFVENFERVVKSLREPGLEVELVEGPDDICAACPHLSNGRCLKGEEKASGLDERAAKRLGLSAGSVLAFFEIEAVLDALKAEDILGICLGCEWLEKGYCAS